MVSAGLAYPFDLGAAFGAELTVKPNKYVGAGLRGYFGGEKYTQLEIGAGPYIPIKIGSSIALTPFANVGFGFMFCKNTEPKINTTTILGGGSVGSNNDLKTIFGISGRAGMIFTTSWVPGLFIEASYQYNFYKSLEDTVSSAVSGSGNDKNYHPNVFYIGVGYSF